MEAERLLTHFAMLVAQMRRLQIDLWAGLTVEQSSTLTALEREVDEQLVLLLLPGTADPYTAITEVQP